MMFKINFQDQLSDFFADEENSFSVITENGIEKKQARYISKGDLIVGNKKHSDNLNNPYFIKYNCDSFNFDGSVTLELAEFLGYFISFCPYLYKDKIVMKNPASIDFFYNSFNKFFGNKNKFIISDHTLSIESYSSVVNFLIYLGVLFENHEVPFCIKNSSNEFISSFIVGFLKNKIIFKLDKTYQLQIRDLSLHMAKEIQFLLNLIGVYSVADQNDESYFLKIGGYSNLKRFSNCIKTDVDHNLKIIQNNYFFKTGIKSEKLQKLFLKNVPDKNKDEMKLFDIYDIESFIDFEENIGNNYYSHMAGMFDYPIYCVSNIDFLEAETLIGMQNTNMVLNCGLQVVS